jgi:hypothetical protein
MGGDVLDRTVLIGAHGGGWNGLAVRFRAADEYAASAIHLLTTLPGSPPNEDRYAEERELFGFFANAVAAIESCCFAIYHVGLMAQPPFFAKPPDEVTLKATATAVANAFPGTRLAASSLISTVTLRGGRSSRSEHLHAPSVLSGTDRIRFIRGRCCRLRSTARRVDGPRHRPRPIPRRASPRLARTDHRATHRRHQRFREQRATGLAALIWLRRAIVCRTPITLTVQAIAVHRIQFGGCAWQSVAPVSPSECIWSRASRR